MTQIPIAQASQSKELIANSYCPAQGLFYFQQTDREVKEAYVHMTTSHGFPANIKSKVVTP